MIDERIIYLFDNYCRKTASDEERVEFFNWIADSNNSEDAQFLMASLYDREMEGQNETIVDLDKEAILKYLVGYQREELKELRRHEKIRLMRRWAVTAAASIVIFLISSWLVTVWYADDTAESRAVSTKYNIPAGGNKAILTLGDGRKVLLDTLTQGVSIYDGKLQITKMDDGSIVYASVASEGGEILYNTMQTPVGGTFQVLLPDGSRVWLNAMSQLRYPTSFAKQERRVELNGEAYFEVAKDKGKPFVVDVYGLDVRVLGTCFNINSYQNRNLIKTTVVEGAVEVGKENRATVLYPGQQLEYRSDHSSRLLKNVNLVEIMAWKDGFFSTSSITLGALMDEVERWYGVDVEYVEPLDMEFVLKLSKKISLLELITILELTEEVKVELIEKKLRIMKRKKV
ncbi:MULTISPECIES: FecR family protein [Sphingobacterium]|uniref:FecR family protein n=1 Tax=Sphingobacterium TaxID=28453 RepID=UPI0013D97E4D|nr:MULTISPECIES: FecR domain-containing protein [unclassified Sphingobacterium]